MQRAIGNRALTRALRAQLARARPDVKPEDSKYPVQEVYGRPFPRDPKPEDVRQGMIGSCALMSTLEALARSDSGRDYLRKAITPNGPSDKYNVTLIDPRSVKFRSTPQSHVVEVDAWFPLDNGNFHYALKGWKAPTRANPSDIPLWPAIIESAYALVVSRSAHPDTGYPAKASYAAIEHDTIASGDNPLKALTGSAVRVEKITDIDRFEQRAPAEIPSALQRGLPVTAGAGAYKHQYSVVEADARGLKIRDPNRELTGSFPEAGEKWTPDERGSWTITWRQFHTYFADYVTVRSEHAESWKK